MMTRRYLLSILSVLPLIMAYDVVYFFFHRSLNILLAMGAMHVVMYGPLMFLGGWLLYRPIARGLSHEHDVPATLERIGRLTWNSTWLAGGVGLLTVTISLLPVVVLPEMYAGSGAFEVDRIPIAFVLAAVPPGAYVFCIFPAFVTHFLINDFVLDLRARVYTEYGHLSAPGRRRIALTILSVLLVLGLIPLLLVIIELAVAADTDYAQFTQMNPMHTVIIDRFVILIGIVYAVVLVTRSFTKPIYCLLNEYFSVLVTIIQRHKGVVNKFIGDVVFAMFNVPLDDPDHAANAVRAAMEIHAITASRTFSGGRRLGTRIGINTGVVLAGNIGSTERLDYTVIGDAVNVAARLDQLNKQYGTAILAGETTVKLAGERFPFVHVGEVQLKGKATPSSVYGVGAQAPPS